MGQAGSGFVGRRLTTVVASCAGLAAGLADPARASDSSPAVKPNIIFILADDLGYGDLGCYGQRVIQTPRIDQLAAEGMRFTQFYAAPSCAPSRCILNTGFHYGHAAIRCNSCSAGEPALRTEDITVAEMLKRAGYRTGILGKWHKGGSLDNDIPAYVYGAPQNKGFDESYVYMGGGADDYYPPQLWRNGVKELIPENAGGANVVWSHDLFTQEALSFITRNAGGPFFLQVSYTIPHRYLECPSNDPYANQPWPEIEKRFAAMITRMDADVGRIADLVDQLGLGERTLIMFSSDNGPQQREGHLVEFFNSNGELRGMKFDYWEGGIRVPFIARWTNHVAAGTTSDFIGAFYDFMPTAAELAGIKPPGDIDGVSFAPTLLGQGTQAQHYYLYWEGDTGGSRTVRLGDWKGVTVGGSIQLFNLRSDPSETTNVAAQNPLIVSQMSQITADAHRTGPPPVTAPVLALTGDVTGSDTQYTLDFGRVPRSGGPVTRTFRVRNAATSYCNLMEGSVEATAVSDPRVGVAGGDYAWLVDGSDSDAFTVTLTPSRPGPLPAQTVTITGRKYGYGDPAINSPITLTVGGLVVGALPDLDLDGDVDQIDFGLFQACYTALTEAPAPGCEPADFDETGTIDVFDFNEFQRCVGGAGKPPGC